jgi:hypothetical protein
MSKEKLQKIVEDNLLDNVDLQEDRIIVYFGDILNEFFKDAQQRKPELDYVLKECYVELNYSFNPSGYKFHRGIVDFRECEDYRAGRKHYSGFVHYNSNNFCYGESKIDIISKFIQADGINEDNFISLLYHFRQYLSFSNHNTTGSWMRIKNKVDARILEKRFVTDWVNVNGIYFPHKQKYETIEGTEIIDIDYSKESTVLEKIPLRSFTFKGNVIIPQIVEYPTKNTKNLTKNTSMFYPKINLEEKIKTFIVDTNANHIPRTISSQDLFDKFISLKYRVDGNNILPIRR